MSTSQGAVAVLFGWESNGRSGSCGPLIQRSANPKVRYSEDLNHKPYSCNHNPSNADLRTLTLNLTQLTLSLTLTLTFGIVGLCSSGPIPVWICTGHVSQTLRYIHLQAQMHLCNTSVLGLTSFSFFVELYNTCGRMPVETVVCVRDQLRVTELARGETDSRLTDVNSELERQRNDCDTLRDKLHQRQVTLVSFFHGQKLYL